jgi:hypothetical protein
MNAMARISPRQACERDQPHTVDELLFWLPSALKRHPTEFTRGFVVSILARSKRRGWKPSDKQLAIMRRIVADMFAADPADDFDVIDRDG